MSRRHGLTWPRPSGQVIWSIQSPPELRGAGRCHNWVFHPNDEKRVSFSWRCPPKPVKPRTRVETERTIRFNHQPRADRGPPTDDVWAQDPLQIHRANPLDVPSMMLSTARPSWFRRRRDQSRRGRAGKPKRMDVRESDARHQTRRTARGRSGQGWAMRGLA